MLDRIVNQGLNQSQESFYFQLIPISLTLVNTKCDLPAPGTTYRFAVFKGSQKFDENRIPISAQFTKVNGVNALPINSCRLNFYLPSVPKGRKIQFNLRVIQRQNGEDYPLGDYPIDANALIAAFKDESTSRHELKAPFSEDYDLEFEIYVDNNRVALEKNIRDHRQDRAIKSPLRTRKEESTGSARKNFTRDKKVEEAPQRDNEAPSKKPSLQEPEPTADPLPEQPVSEQPPEPSKPIREAKAEGAPAEKSEKNYEGGSVASRNSGGAPLLKTKFKPLSKADTPAEIKMTESQRIGGGKIEKEEAKGEAKGEKLFMGLFLLMGMIVIYWAMTPSSKV